MINVAIYSKNHQEYFVNTLTSLMGSRDYTYFAFNYPMDLLDFLNNARPEECAVFYECDDSSEGVEVALKVRSFNKNYRFNFICSEYGSVEELFYKGVTYYFGKNDVVSSIKRCVERTHEYYSDQENNSLVLSAKNGVSAIPFDSIDYIMSDKRKIIVYCGGSEKSFYYKLDEIESMLGDSFARCHQSYIVNMKRIVSFEIDGVILDTQEFIPVSRKRYFDMKRQYLSFASGNGNILFK